MKFLFATALLAFTQVEAAEISTEAEWGGYGGYSHGGRYYGWTEKQEKWVVSL